MPSGAERQAGRADDEHVLVGLLAEAVGDHGLAGHHAAACPPGSQVEPQHGRLVDDRRPRRRARRRRSRSLLTNSVAVLAVVDHRHVAPGPVDARPGDGAGDLAAGVEHDQAALRPWCAVVPSWLGRLPTITQPAFSIVIAVVSPTPPGHCGRWRGMLANRVSCLRRRVVVDDRGAEALQVVACR